MKPAINNKPENYYLYGPQTLTFARSQDSFFLSTWGVDRDTKEFSSGISWVYKNLSSSLDVKANANSEKTICIDYDFDKKYRTKSELPKLGRVMVSNK